VKRGMSSSSKREENEEKLLQSSRRGDIDSVLVSISTIYNVFVLTITRQGFQEFQNKTALFESL